MRGLALSGESKEFFARGRLAHLRAFWDRGRLSEPRTIIDYGCGVGDVTVLLAQTFPGAQVLGVDPSRNCIDRARLSVSRRVQFAVLGESEQSLTTEADLLHVNGVVHHVAPSERPRLFAALGQLVAPGGIIALFENNPLNPGTRLVMARIPFDRGAVPIRCRRAKALLGEAGLELLDTAYLFYFPRALRVLRRFEPLLSRLPLGAQYAIVARRPHAPPRPMDFLPQP